MSIIVSYEGQRKTIKVQGPNTLMQSVLNEAAEHFKLNPCNCTLRHKRSTIDASQPYRFANLSNNVQVDLVFSASSSSGKLCKIALSVESSSNISGVFDSLVTLYGILEEFQREGKLPLNLFELGPEVVYLRSMFNNNEQLRNTTLVSLGLSGQSARLQLRYLNKNIVPVYSDVAPGSSVSAPSVRTESSSPMNVVSEPIRISSHSVEQPVTATSTPMTVDVLEHCTAQVSVSELIVNNDSVTSEPISMQAEFIPVLSDVNEQISAVLQQNFDRVSLPAVITITKYVINIINNPENCEKFLTVNCVNKVYTEKVAPCKGAVELLNSIGFLSPATSVFSRAGSALVMTSPVDHRFLSAVYEALQSALTELNVEDGSRPLRVDPASVQRRTEEIKAVPFDPYKSNIVRTAQQPVRVKSHVEEQLEQLNKRRLEIEGNIEDVSRNTEALFPNSKGEVDSLPSPPEDESSSSGGGSGGVPKSLISKILKKEEEPPLTTKAIRDLQKAQKTKIYSRTLIRVRFPDRMCLQGYFHPRNTLQDVYQWVLSSLVPEAREILENSSSSTSDGSVVELYTTPPRTVLFPLKGTAASVTTSLTDLQFVPAAVMYAGWNDAHPVVQYLRNAGLIDTPYANTSVGRYLAESILLAADEKVALSTSAIPVGAPLVPSAVKSEGSSSELTSQGEKQPDSSSDSKAKGPAKPKWFKL